jgi:hypothetical protein
MDDNNLTLNDLENMKSLIDVACSRGAFKANEMKDIGELYNKLANFLKQMSAVQTPDPSVTPPSGE